MHLPNIFVALSVGFVCVALLFVGALVRPTQGRRQSHNGSYDSGLEAEGKPWIKTPLQFQLVCSVCLLFTVSAIILLMVAVDVRAWIENGLGKQVLIGLGAFITILVVSLAHAWSRNDLNWKEGDGRS